MRVENCCDIENRFYKIDKTDALETAISRFPSVYIEGAASSGKTTAVRMLADKHPEVTVKAVLMDRCETYGELSRKLSEIQGETSGASEIVWTVFENLPGFLPEEIQNELIDYVRRLKKRRKVFFVSREQPPEKLLDLLWKGQMEIIPQRELLLTPGEVRELTQQTDSPLQPQELYQVTGGWAGCVDVMLRLSSKDKKLVKESGNTDLSAAMLRQSYEIDTYIQHAILDTLTEQEQQIMKLGRSCPWFNERICREVWNLQDREGISDVGKNLKGTLEGLERKGLLTAIPREKCWRVAPLFAEGYEPAVFCGQADQIRSQKEYIFLADWYEKNGYFRDALQCIRQTGQKKKYCEFLIRHYDQVSGLGISCEEILDCQEQTPQVHYLRGLYFRASGDFEKLSVETEAIGPKHPELYLNLMFADPQISLEQWMHTVKELCDTADRKGQHTKFRLYDILGDSHTYLCGVRDLSELFACTKKEEHSRAAIWKRAFGEAEWQAYCLARMDFYLETERSRALHEEDQELLSGVIQPDHLHRSMGSQSSNLTDWQNALAGLYLECRLQEIQPDEERRNRIVQLSEQLRHTGEPSCVRRAEAVMCIFSGVLGNLEKLGQWLILNESREASELMHTEQFFQIRGYLLLHQYRKAGSLLQKLLPHLEKYHMKRMHAEAMYQQAIVNWYLEKHGKALQNVITSFLINGSCRYVGFYASYGKAGAEVLNAYIDWMKNNVPGGWKRKKKYNYGNVLRMPVEDYMNVILRKCKHAVKKEKNTNIPEQNEVLTMMETIVLQAICQGLSNAEISEQQNLKITTVKSHIYSLYRKLGVKSRMQAALKGKELGIV